MNEVLWYLFENNLFSEDSPCILVGTCAFKCYVDKYRAGVNYDSLTYTNDIDIAIPIGGVCRFDIVNLIKSIGFCEVPALSLKNGSSSFIDKHNKTRIDIICPMIGKPAEGEVFLKSSNLWASPIRYVDILISEYEIYKIFRNGIWYEIKIPSLELFLLGKLISASTRSRTEVSKIRKDILQVDFIIQSMIDDSRYDNLSSIINKMRCDNKKALVHIANAATLLCENSLLFIERFLYS